MTWHIKRDYDSIGFPRCAFIAQLCFLWPDISKGITTIFCALPTMPIYGSFLWPDISKGITTQLPRQFLLLCLKFSMTWHIKRDYDYLTAPFFTLHLCVFYDLTYQKGLRHLIKKPSVGILSPGFLWPDISKGITTIEELDNDFKKSLEFSMTWHIKRDYDIVPPLKLPPVRFVFYDLTYQKGLRHNIERFDSRFHWCFLWPDISKGITTLVDFSRNQNVVSVFYDLTYQKGLRH